MVALVAVVNIVGLVGMVDAVGLVPEVESSRTRFEVLCLGLEASSPWPWPRSLRSSKIALSSARGQHYLLTVEILL